MYVCTCIVKLAEPVKSKLDMVQMASGLQIDDSKKTIDWYIGIIKTTKNEEMRRNYFITSIFLSIKPDAAFSFI